MTLDGDAQLGNSEQQVYKVICEDGSVIDPMHHHKPFSIRQELLMKNSLAIDMQMFKKNEH